MKETGRILREARETQNISLAAVSAVTKINLKVLEAIENANMENLPSKTFLRGFVQTYANFLKLSSNDILDLFQREMGSTKYTPAVPNMMNGNLSEEQPMVENSQSREPMEKPSSAHSKETDAGLAFANGGRSLTSKIIFGVIVLGLILGIYIVSEIVQKYQRESQVTEAPPEVQSNPISETPKGPEAADQKASPPAKPMDVKPTDTKPAEVKVEAKVEPKPQVKPTTETTPVEPKVAEPPAVVPGEVKPDADTKPPPPPPVPQEIIVEALDTVKVDYRIDGGSLQTVTLQPEEKRTFKAKREVKMDVSDGGAVNINQNGRDKGVPGNLGQSMKLSFP